MHLEAKAEPAPGNGRRVLWLSPGYASPEQFLAEPLSPASDVYSLGIVLYEMLTGIRPQPADPAELRAFLANGAPRPSEAILHAEPDFGAAAAVDRRLGSGEALAERLSGKLDTIVGRCLEVQPECRYSSAGQLVRAIVALQFEAA